MKEKKDNTVMCCFCSDSLPFENAIQLTIIIDKNTDESQTVFCHKQCLDKALHKSVPRHPDLIEK